MRVSKRTEYGLRAVIQLARLWPKTFVQSKDLAQLEALPNKFLESILLALRRGGFLESKVGSGGGYRLSRAPREISVGDLIRRLEGRLTIQQGVPPSEMSPGNIAVRLINEKLTAATDDVLDHMTLEELMEHVNLSRQPTAVDVLYLTWLASCERQRGGPMAGRSYTIKQMFHLFHFLPKFHIPLHWIVEKMDIGWKGYVVLFALLFSAGLGVPIPEDIPLLVAGMLIATGHMNLLAAAIVAWCGIVGGDIVLYHLGKHYGLEITRVPLIGRHVTRERILKAEKLFEKHGTWVVAVGRLFAGVRGAMVIAAGAIRFNLTRFLVADGLAAVASGGLFLYLGHKFGEHLADIEPRIAHYSRAILLAATGLVLVFIAVQLWKHKKHTTFGDLALEKTARLRKEHPHQTSASPSNNGTAAQVPSDNAAPDNVPPEPAPPRPQETGVNEFPGQHPV